MERGSPPIILVSLLLFSLTLPLSISTDVSAQTNDENSEWTMLESFGALNASDSVYDVVINPETGDAYVTGTFIGNATFGTINLTNPNWGSPEIFVANMDSSGVWHWAVSAGGDLRDEGLSIALDESGVYVTGFFQSNNIFFGDSLQLANEDQTVPNYSISNYTMPTIDGFVAKLDFEGNWLWARGMHGNETDSGVSVKSHIGGIVVSGTFTSASLNMGSNAIANKSSHSVHQGYDVDLFVVGYDTEGREMWVVVAGEWNSDVVTDMELDDSGNVYLTGHVTGAAAYFLPHKPLNSGIGFTDGFVAKLSANLTWEWVALVGGTDSDEILGLDVGEDGGVYVVGTFASKNITFRSSSSSSVLAMNNSEPPKNLTIQSRDGFVAKISESGQWVWAVNATGEWNEEVVQVTVLRNHVVISLTATSDTYSILDSTYHHSIALGQDYCFMSLTTDGEFEWGIPMGWWAIPEWISMDSTGSDVFFAGEFMTESLDWGVLSAKNANYGVPGFPYTDGFVARLTLVESDSDSDGIPDWADADDDDDGLLDEEEAEYGTDPLNPDSDGDGFDDGDEVLGEHDPMDSEDYPQRMCCSSSNLIESALPAILVGLLLLLFLIRRKKQEND